MPTITKATWKTPNADSLEASVRSGRFMSHPRDHHFVPVFYLQHWANQDGKLIEYSRPYRNRIVAKTVGPKATGFRRDLYAFQHLPAELAQYLEDKFLKRADDKASVALAKLLSGNAEPPWIPELRSAWSRFVINSIIRHPHPFEEIRAVLHDYWLEPDGVTQQEYERLRQAEDPPTFEEYVLLQGDHLADRIRIRFLQTALDNERAGVRLNNMNWNVLDLSGANLRLLTSDWPLYREINGERMAFTLPISPTALFTATTHPDIFRALQRMRANELVRTINAEVVSQARLYVYSRDRSQDQFVTNHMSSKMQPQPFFPSLARGRPANAPIVRA
jgi:uncharacterized protein DUF4238